MSRKTKINELANSSQQVYLKTQTRFFSNYEKAKQAQPHLANIEGKTVYISKLVYGRDDDVEYSLRFEEEVLCPQAQNIISVFVPKNLKITL